jgi:hypothetical protein
MYRMLPGKAWAYCFGSLFSFYPLRTGQVQLTSSRGAIVDYLGKEDFFAERAFLKPQARGQLAKSISAAGARI